MQRVICLNKVGFGQLLAGKNKRNVSFIVKNHKTGLVLAIYNLKALAASK
jgi:hypothetical protein